MMNDVRVLDQPGDIEIHRTCAIALTTTRGELCVLENQKLSGNNALGPCYAGWFLGMSSDIVGGRGLCFSLTV